MLNVNSSVILAASHLEQHQLCVHEHGNYLTKAYEQHVGIVPKYKFIGSNTAQSHVNVFPELMLKGAFLVISYLGH